MAKTLVRLLVFVGIIDAFCLPDLKRSTDKGARKKAVLHNPLKNHGSYPSNGPYSLEHRL